MVAVIGVVVAIFDVKKQFCGKFIFLTTPYFRHRKFVLNRIKNTLIVVVVVGVGLYHTVPIVIALSVLAKGPVVVLGTGVDSSFLSFLINSRRATTLYLETNDETTLRGRRRPGGLEYLGF